MNYQYSEEDVGPGWQPIVKQAIDDIAGLGGQITQIKEKFGGLRIYYYSEDNHDMIGEVIQNAENECAKLCEYCGKPGKLKEINGLWLKTVCEEHGL